MTKLYNVKPKTWVMPIEKTSVPPEAREVSIGEPIFFDHIDGMYSYCKDIYGKVVHLAAWQDVTEIDPPI